jgi:hypothetical protein
MKKKYQLEYYDSARMVIEIDHAVFTDEEFKECSEFWSNKPNLKEWLKMIYTIALRESIASLSALATLKEGREEGFPKMDGTRGLTIVSFDRFEFDDFEMSVTEIS